MSLGSKKGIKTMYRKLLFIAILFMFNVSTVYWILKIIDLLSIIRGLDGMSSSGGKDYNASAERVLGAFALINYILTDGVVLWRAWVLCNMESKWLLFVPLFFLVCCSLIATIAIRITLEVIPVAESSTYQKLTRAIDICQIANLVFSLIINFSTTLIIAMKAWYINIAGDSSFIIAESTSQAVPTVDCTGPSGHPKQKADWRRAGLFYCISGATVLVSSLIRLPFGTLGDIYTPVNIQVAGIYPIVVLLLVSQGKSLDRTVFNTMTQQAPIVPNRSAELGNMSFHVASRLSRINEVDGRYIDKQEERGRAG
ncbi:hypothetical protein WG66_009052 [Moniliophthora roreri]|nr:hypothetical protein WG66_009052 [Moniliophthora roreri]